MFSTGVVIGKFYPPHRGHKHLIDTAQAQCRELAVVVCARAGEAIPGRLRPEWLRRIHPAARVLLVEDYTIADDDSAGWARFTVALLGHAPEAVFTSEAYGDAYAAHMGAKRKAKSNDRVPAAARRTGGSQAHRTLAGSVRSGSRQASFSSLLRPVQS